MALYLQMNGTSDKIQLPSMTFTEIILDMSTIRSTSSTKFYLDARTGIGFAYFQSNTNGTDSWSTFNNVYVDGVSKTNNTIMIPNNQRCLVRVVKTTAGTDDITIFSSNSGSNGTFMQGNLYNIKVYNGATLQAHYDMSTGTVQDQSGNGRHATLTGGTWLDDGVGGGTVGSLAYAVKQSIYRTSFSTFDSKLVQYKVDSSSFDNKQTIFNTSSLSYSTKQAINKTANTIFDTLQELYDGGLIGSTEFDTLMSIYANKINTYDTKQSQYQTSVKDYDFKQSMYRINQINGDTSQSLYKSYSNKLDLKQTIYHSGMKEINTKQFIYNNDTIGYATKNILIKQSNVSFNVKQIISKLDAMEIYLEQKIYNSSSIDYKTTQQLLADFKVYRQIIEYILQVNTKNNYDLHLPNSRKSFDLKI